MEQKNITLTIDGKIHKLMDSHKLIPCSNCSLNDLCHSKISLCPAETFGGEYFVELKVEK